MPHRSLNVVPLERLEVSPDVDGHAGTNRPPTPPKIPAADDLEAIACWLHEYLRSPHTARSYRREAERLLLWALLERGKPLSSLDAEDLRAYRRFLTDPQPRERWCADSGAARTGRVDWKPFRGPLGRASQRQAAIVLRGLFAYLTSQQYLERDPLADRGREDLDGDETRR